MIISIDYDDVLFPFIEPLLIELNSMYNLKITAEDILGWEIKSYIPLTNEQIFEPIYRDEFWKGLLPNDDALWLTDKLISDGHEIQVVTASFYQNVKPKVEQLLKYFPIRWENIIIASNKSRIITDVLIDDGVHNLIGGQYHKILLDKPHNRNFDDSSNNIFRIKNLKEAYHIINSILTT